MGYQITCKYPEICIQSHEKPTPVKRHQHCTSGLKSPSAVGQGEGVDGVPKVGVLHNSLENHSLDKSLGKME